MIRFPQKHVADSVIERIMQAEREINSVKAQGDKLDQALNTPVGDVAPIEGIEEMIPAKTLGF